MKHENDERAKIGQHVVYEKRQERIWLKMRKLYVTKALRFEKSHEPLLRDLSRFWGLGIPQQVAKVSSGYTDTLLATFEKPLFCDITTQQIEKGKEGTEMNVFKAVKENVTPMDAARFYGLKVNRHGMCICPFHNDQNPSMKIDKEIGKGFYCFGCQEAGDVIDLVAKLHGIGKYEAAKMLADDFHIFYDAIGNELPAVISEKEKEHMKKKQDDRAFAERKRDLCRFILAVMSEMREEKFLAEGKAMKVLEEDETYNWVINRLDRIEDDYEYILGHTDEEVKEVIDEIEKGVMAYAGEFIEIRGGSKRAS